MVSGAQDVAQATQRAGIESRVAKVCRDVSRAHIVLNLADAAGNTKIARKATRIPHR